MDIDREITIAKVDRALDIGARDAIEYMVDGAAIGEQGMIPCAVESESKGSCSILIADGDRTGERLSVPSRHIYSFGGEFVKDACGRLFR